MNLRGTLVHDSLGQFHRPSPPDSATQKPPALRIVVPPTEYCPFSTDLILPTTLAPLSTPVPSLCFTFSDLVNQDVFVPPTPAPALADSVSPTSSQFLLMPPTLRVEDVDREAAFYVSPLATSGAANAPMYGESHETKSENLRPYEVSSSTWLSELGGRTETDRIFRHNLLDTAESSSPSTPALSPSALSPSSLVSSSSAYNSPTPLARSSTSLPAALSTMSLRSSSPARLVLQPTGTDAFPSTLDGLQAWRESVTPGLPRSDELPSPLSEDVHGPQMGESTQETPVYPSSPSHQMRTHLFFPRSSRVSRAQTLIKRAKTFGGRVKRLVIRQSMDKHRSSSMDQGVNFRVLTSQDSENGSVVLITAPPPPYDARPPTLTSHGSTIQEHARSRTISEYSSVVQTSTVEHAVSSIAEPSSRQLEGSSNRNALRRLSFAALSTIKRF